MANYPASIDNDRSIIRIDDNLSELGSSAINQLREAVFTIEKAVGINPQGSKSSLNERISVSINPDGSIRTEALQSVGLATLPISDNQVASNAGIKETKLQLNYPTGDLHTAIVAAQSQVELVQDLINEENTNFLIHLSGGTLLVDELTKARHVASHIDLNAVPVDSRDTYVWTGLLDINGDLRPATHVAEALLEINNELVGHETATSTLVHPASAISVDSSQFEQLPAYIVNVQQALSYVDNQEALSTGVDRATLNSNGIPRTARIQDLQRDGYTINVVPVTKVHAYLAEPSDLAPNDNINNGDDVIRFFPDNSNFTFDALFTNVKIGDIIRINYGNGIEAQYPIMAIRFIAGSEWAVRINANNLFDAGDGYDGYARIDRPNFDSDTWGVFAAAGVVPNVSSTQPSMNSVILGSPQGAVAVGLGFDPNKINVNHYNLYLRLYPTGDPNTFFDLPAIDVSGNAGTTPGYYNIDIVVENVNKQFRASGYNYRFIAFNQKGEFGIMLADVYDGAAFTIISGQLNSSTGGLETGPYVANIVGDAVDLYDALGLGFYRSGFATPVMSRSGIPVPYPTAIAASNYSTLIIYPVSNRNAIINGTRRDTLAKPRFTEQDGYWNAVVSNVTTDIVNNTIRVTYAVSLDLAAEGLFPGKTIVVQPSDPSDTSIQNYGRFIIDTLTFSCTGSGQTNITVLNTAHATTNPLSSALPIGTHVRIYFSSDSVMFNLGNMNGADSSTDPTDYHHYHEVFVNENGKSVAVERARIPHSNNGSIPALVGFNNIGAFDNWRIRRISPKLQGYRSGVVTNFRHFIQFWVENFDSTTGEFDIYLSNLDFTARGPLARGKKNHPVRVYDESYINFVDIEFREVSPNPGTVFPSTGFVAMELFPSLINDDENFVIAGVHHNGASFRTITDLRDFGTISEENFSDSAIKFIQAGERYLHTNGIVRGFVYEGPGVDNYTLLFNGGMALVNGAFVQLDSMSVNLPVLSTVSDTVEHFICVTETGQLISIVKNTGAQFFDATSGNFVESLTFKDIVDSRKDLAIIAKASVTISTATVVVTDARKHIVNGDLDTYSWSYSDQATPYGIDQGNPNNASFITGEALVNWVNEYDVLEVKVKEVTVNSKLVLNFNPTGDPMKPTVVLKGGVYNINSVQGISFESGSWKIDDADITYTPTIGGTFDTGDIFNTKSNWGAILMDLANILSMSFYNFGIENSRFHSASVQRPPFVGIYSCTGNGYNGLANARFINNSFFDDNAGNALCYAFVNGNTPDISAAAPLLQDFLVSGTKINMQQGILVAGRATPNTGGHGYTAMNFVQIENFTIKDNRFGLIGFNVQNFIGTFEAGRFIIDNNKCELMYSGFTATMHPTDLTFSDVTNSVTGNSVAFCVTENDCYNMKIEATAGPNGLKSRITGNNIKRWDDTLLIALVPDPVPWAMLVVNSGFYPTNATISNNTIDGLNFSFSGSNGYMHSIRVIGGGATITGNTIDNIATGGNGIWNDSTTSTEQSTIVGNTLGKADGIQIGAYIYSTANATIYGNNLSDFDLNSWHGGGSTDGYGDFTGSNFSGIIGPGAAFAAWNTNQVVRMVPNMASAIPIFHITYAPSDGIVTATENDERLLYGKANIAPISYEDDINIGLHKITFNEQNGWKWLWSGVPNGIDPFIQHNDGTVGLIIPVSSVVPDRAYLLSLSITITFSPTEWDIWDNGNIPAHTTFPEVALELNGNIVAWENPNSPTLPGNTPGHITLIYQSDALVNGIRPPAPLVKEVVVKMRQGTQGVNTPQFGGWIGPAQHDSHGMATMTISQPWVTYLY